MSKFHFLKPNFESGGTGWAQKILEQGGTFEKWPIEISILHKFQKYRRKFVNSSFDWKFDSEKHLQ